jgi:hypothetical protein
MRYAAVIDGHAKMGSEIAHLVRTQLPQVLAAILKGKRFSDLSNGDFFDISQSLFKQLNQLIQQNSQLNIGGCAIALTLRCLNHFYVANSGDCRVLHLKKEGSFEQCSDDAVIGDEWGDGSLSRHAKKLLGEDPVTWYLDQHESIFARKGTKREFVDHQIVYRDSEGKPAVAISRNWKDVRVYDRYRKRWDFRLITAGGLASVNMASSMGNFRCPDAGQEPNVSGPYTMEEGDRIVSVTDGVSSLLTSAQIAAICQNQPSNELPKRLARVAMGVALLVYERLDQIDNTTVIVAE